MSFRVGYASIAIEHGARLAPFGFDVPEAIESIAAAARSIGEEPDEVWCAGGSGVLARGLAQLGRTRADMWSRLAES